MIFIDTGPFVARYIAADSRHKDAVSYWDKAAKDREAMFTSSFVLDEAFTLMGRRAGYGFAAQRAENIYASKTLTILRPDHEDELNALKLFKKFADQQTSFTDCISFVLMRRNKINRVFAFDAHFSLLGFTLVP
ncbi:MAG: PIN domain-containing protein [Thermodesulfobacteriota bacterium]